MILASPQNNEDNLEPDTTSEEPLVSREAAKSLLEPDEIIQRSKSDSLEQKQNRISMAAGIMVDNIKFIITGKKLTAHKLNLVV